MDTDKPVKVVIVEDDTSFLESVTLLFADFPLIEIVDTYVTGRDAVKGIIEKHPDAALIDLGLPDISGVDVIKEIHESGLGTELLVLTVYNDDEHLFSALRAGAAGYIVKDELSLSEIACAIDEAVRGGAPMSMDIARRLLHEFRNSKKKPINPKLETLTAREAEILEYLSKGYSARKVADALYISYETVRSHQKNIYRKLQVNSLLEAVTLFRK